MGELDQRLETHRAAWESKGSTRTVYGDYHRRIAAEARDGTTLEVGAGSGHLRGVFDDLVAIDILASPWLDVVADAHRMPFADEMFDNIVMMDVLHHLVDPARFFDEAVRLLRPGGRVVMIEPGISPFSRLFYTYVHPEPVDLDADPLARQVPEGVEFDPFDSNQAIPTQLFAGAHVKRFREAFPMLTPITVEWLSLFAYPLSGGFQKWTLLSGPMASRLLRLEDRLVSKWGRRAGFRLLVTLERRSS